MSINLEMLELVAAIRQIMSVAKSLQEKNPDFTPQDIAMACDGAINIKHARLAQKGYSKLSDVQRANFKALSDAKLAMPHVQSILEQARERTAEEIADGLAANETKAAKRKEAAIKRQAAKEAKADAEASESNEDMFADA